MNMFGLGGMGSLFTMPSMDMGAGVTLPNTNAVNGYINQPAIGGMGGAGAMGAGEALNPTGAMGTVPTNQPSGFESGMRNTAYGTQILGGLGGLYYGGKAVNTMGDQQDLAEENYNYQVSEQETEDEYLAGINF